jgi:serine protease Do
VVAVGNPFGLEGTVTAGIVSARGRDIGSGPYDSFLQIDAPINQGNSGGPLFAQDGSVVGVNSAIISPTGGSVGIGFAIPSDTVKSVVTQLQRDGHVTRGYLGVETQPIDAGMVAALHLKKVEPGHAGALVASVSDDSPASKAGLQPGDVIQAVNGASVTTPRELALDVAGIKPGDEAKLDVVRDGDTKSVSVTVGTMPDQQMADNGASRGQDAEGQAKVGLALAPLSPDLRDQLGVPERTKGVVVAQVENGSPADAAGIRQGDVIVGVGDQSVGSVDQAMQAIKTARRGASTLALRIVRDGHAGFVAVNLNPHKDADAETDNG